MAEEKEIVNISSSEEEDDYYEEDEDDEEEEEGDNEETGDADWSLSGNDSEWSEGHVTESDHDGIDDDDDDGDDENGDGDDDEDEDFLVNKVIRLLEDGCDLKGLKMRECRSYLRKHGLRLSGTKEVCIERIIEHWRMKDGNGEAIYPRSSFIINCRGDVCKGDVVLFSQKVYQKFDKMKRRGKLSGTRTIAGKVIKESYGEAKQQHTFTIEVLWSKGMNKLPSLHPLLVKGRNLYRLRTFRQPWANEEDRQKVLSEKHNRGAAARKVRDMRKARKMQSANLKRDDIRQKHDCEWKPYQEIRTRKAKMKKHAKEHENPPQSVRQDTAGTYLYPNPFQRPSKGHKNRTQRKTSNNNSHSYIPQAYAPHPHIPRSYISSDIPRSDAPHSNVPHSYTRWPHSPYSYASRSRASHTYAYTMQNDYISQNPLNQHLPPFYNGGFTSNVMRQTSFDPHANTSTVPISSQGRSYGNHYTHHPNPSPSYNSGVRDLDHFSEIMISQRSEGNAYRQKNHCRR